MLCGFFIYIISNGNKYLILLKDFTISFQCLSSRTIVQCIFYNYIDYHNFLTFYTIFAIFAQILNIFAQNSSIFAQIFYLYRDHTLGFLCLREDLHLHNPAQKLLNSAHFCTKVAQN